ncbi:hypothetical protein JCM9279_007215 [Rhodotorula babjevae]
MSQPAEHHAPQRESRVTALDVFGSALRLVVEERAKSVKDGKPAALLALDGLAGLVAAYIALNHEHHLELPSASLLLDARWPCEDALVMFCHDSAEAPPPLVQHLVQENPIRNLPRYGLEMVPTVEAQSQKANFRFRLLSATHLSRFVQAHVVHEGHLKASGHRQHLVRIPVKVWESLDRAKMEQLDFSAVRPTAIAVWALEVLCSLDKVDASSYGACMLLRLVYALECETRISPQHLKEVWMNKRDWLECLRITAANGELDLLTEGVGKLSKPALLDALAEWEVKLHGGDKRRVWASYSRAMTMYGSMIKDTVAHLSKEAVKEHRARLSARTGEAAQGLSSSSSMPHLGGHSTSAQRSSDDPYDPVPRHALDDPYALPPLQQPMHAAELAERRPSPVAPLSPDAHDGARRRKRERYGISAISQRLFKRREQDGEAS